MKIVFIPYRYFENLTGGVETCARHITARLKARGHTVTIIATSMDGKESFQIIEGIEVYKLPFWNHVHFLMKGDAGLYLREILGFPYVLFKMWIIFLKKKPDVVNMHLVGPQSAALLILSYVVKFKIILTLQGFGTQFLNSPLALGWSKILFKKLLKRADFITSPSRNLIEDAVRWEPGIKEKSRVIPHGVDRDEFDTGHRINNYKYSNKGVAKLKRYIYTDYKYWPDKNYGPLLFSFKSLLDLGYDIDLTLSIRDSQRQKYDEMLGLLGIRQRVEIIDYKSKIDRQILLRDSHFYISLSQSQFCDFTALEALSLGKPVIADMRNDLRRIKAGHDGIILIDARKESEIISGVEALLGKEDMPFKEILLENYLGISPYILTVCNPCRYKGVSTLIKAFKIVSEGFPDLSLVIAGDGGQKEYLKRFSERIGLKDKIIFLGTAARIEVVRLFKGCRFFVLPSWIEPFGIVNLEAMAAGKAIIASNVDGIPEIVKNNFNGILVEPRNNSALAEAMLKLLNDEKLRTRLGENGRKTIKGPRFSWDNITKQYINCYRDVLQ